MQRGDIGNPKLIVISGRDPRVIPDAIAATRSRRHGKLAFSSANIAFQKA